MGQATYNLTGQLLPVDATMGDRVERALHATLGNGVNATLVSLSSPSSAVDSGTGNPGAQEATEMAGTEFRLHLGA